MRNRFLFIALSTLIALGACNDENVKETTDNNEQPAKQIDKPDFNPDSAYAYIEKQVNFGPRVPDTKEHRECAEWLQQKLNEFCDTVYIQNVQVKAGDGKMLPCINLIGAINPNAKRRILLLAHWDT